MLNVAKGSIPLYMQIKELLTARISQGEWLPGDSIPSEIKLSHELGVSQGTVRKAITELVESNVLRRQQGRGTFVSNHDSSRALFHFFHIVDNHGIKVLPDSKVLRFREKNASKREASILQLAEGAEVIRIERIRYLGRLPTMVETISLPAKFFGGMGIDGDYDLPNTLYEYYEKRFGITIQSSEEKLRAIAASKRDATLLNIDAGTPLLEIERVALRLDKTPVELRVSRCSTRHHHYENKLY